jgi:L-lactate dehydrogenase
VRLLEQTGLPTDKSEVVASVLLEGDLLGHTTHGLALLSDYIDELVQGRMAIAGEPEIVTESPATAVWDGRRLPGPWLVTRAVEKAAERAQEQGSFTIVIRRSHHIACLAAYLKAVTDRGMMLLLASSDPNTESVAPFGGTRRLITPNPLAVGIPTGGDPILIDISMSATTNGMTARARAVKQMLPHAWILDGAGNPTRDPVAFFSDPPGSILPLGGMDSGYKGFALGLMIEALTAALGGFGRADPKEGWGASVFVQVIDPARLASRPAFERQMQELVTRALAGPVAAGHDSIRLPGQRGLRQREQQLESGVVLHGSIMPRLAAWAKKFDVEPPLPF